MASGADIVDGRQQICCKLALDSEIPLFRVRILPVGVEEICVALSERAVARQQGRSERIGSGRVWRRLRAARIVEVVKGLGTKTRPGTNGITCQLGGARQIVEEDAECGSYCGFRIRAKGKSKPRLNVLCIVLQDFSCWRYDDVSRQRSDVLRIDLEISQTVDEKANTYSVHPRGLEAARSVLPIWVQMWVQSCQIPAKTVYYDATPDQKNQ
jgi:hypothetical protein